MAPPPIPAFIVRGCPPHFHVLNRSKRSVSIARWNGSRRELVSRADIVVTGWMPARLRAPGLDYAALALLNQRSEAEKGNQLCSSTVRRREANSGFEMKSAE